MQPIMPKDFAGSNFELSGWCHFEATVSSILKPWDQRLNLARSTRTERTYDLFYTNCKASRPPPVTPAAFSDSLDACSFTNGSDSFPVKSLFQTAFQALTENARELDFSNLAWGEAQAKVLAEVLPFFTHCTSLNLSRNPFGVHGLSALFPLLPKMPRLESLSMQKCRGIC